MAASFIAKAKLFNVLETKLHSHVLKFSRYITVASKCEMLPRRRTVLSINRISHYSFPTAISNYSQVKQQNISSVSKEALSNFATKINWSISSEEILICAFTHKSYLISDTEENLIGKSLAHNERLIYLGHQTASSFLTESLYFKFPTLSPEQLWDLQNGLLHQDMLEKIGRNLGLQDLIFSKVEINGQMIAEALLAVIASMYMDQPPQLVRDFVESYFIHDLTDEAVKEICQLEHPKIMLVQLNPETIFTAKVIEQESDHDIYGDEKENFKVGIFEQDIMLAAGEGSPLSQAEKNACRNLLKEKYLDRLKTADLPFNLSEYEINFGLLPEGIRVVEIEKGINGFGFSVKGGEMRSEENREFVKYHYYFPPFISSVVDNGPGERVGLREGDVILAVNNKSTKGMDHYHFVRYLKSLKGKVKFTVKNSERVLIIDEIETKFRKFKERKMVSQLADQQWSKWHLANSQKNHDEYERHLREKSHD